MLCGFIGTDVIQQVAPGVDADARSVHVSTEEANCSLYDKDSSKTFVTVNTRRLSDGLEPRKRVDEFVADPAAKSVSVPGLGDLGYGRVAVVAPSSSPESGETTEVYLAVVTGTRLIRMIYRPIDGADGDPADDAVAIAKDIDANLVSVQSDRESDSSARHDSPADSGPKVSAAAPSWLSSRLG